MLESFKPGDKLIVEKWTLGPRMPYKLKLNKSKGGVKEKHLIGINEEPYRFGGLSEINHNDLLVFNDPRERPNLPLELSPALFSRCIGLPGDTLFFKENAIIANGKVIERPLDATACFMFDLKSVQEVENCIKQEFPDKKLYHRNDTGFVFMTQFEYMKISVESKGNKLPLVPYLTYRDDQQIIVPCKGFKIKLDKGNLKKWRDLLDRYENVVISRSGSGKYEINGVESDYYTFKHDYYWMLNDHQGFLNDSRSLGPISETQIIGKALVVLYSPDSKHIFQKIR
jgi:signal peptidase I